MTVRWVVAGVVTIVAAFQLSNTWVPRLWSEAPPQRGVAKAVCDTNAKPARLDFTVKDMSGKDVKLSAYKGKVILLDFWATWCGPCKVEIPWFVEFQHKYRDKGLVVLGFSVDDPVDKLQTFARHYKMNYPVLVGLGRDDVQDAYGPIWGIPTTFLIGRDGTICKRHMGLGAKDQFEKQINALL